MAFGSFVPLLLVGRESFIVYLSCKFACLLENRFFLLKVAYEICHCQLYSKRILDTRSFLFLFYRYNCCLVITGDKIPEVESTTQGLRPRLRTQKKSETKAKDSLSGDRPSRGQGQKCSRPRPRTQPQVFSNKKGLQKSFLGDLQFIGIPRVFDWGMPKSQILCNDVIKKFPNRKFLWDKDIKGWKI